MPSSKPTPPPHRLTTTTATLSHIQTLLTNTKTLDTTLLTTTYTLHLLHSLLTHPHLPLTKSHPLQRLTTTLPPLTSLLSTYRLHLRLTALLPIALHALKTYLHPPASALKKTITWAQILACAIFQALENAAFLAGTGVLGWKRERVEGAWRWSGRAWGVYVGLEFLRLGLEGREMVRGGGKKGEVEDKRGEDGEVGGGELEVRGEKGGDVESKDMQLAQENEAAREKWKKWTRELSVNAAYAPITVHYSLENGALGEGSLGALGMVVGWLTIGKAWRESA